MWFIVYFILVLNEEKPPIQYLQLTEATYITRESCKENLNKGLRDFDLWIEESGNQGYVKGRCFQSKMYHVNSEQYYTVDSPEDVLNPLVK